MIGLFQEVSRRYRVLAQTDFRVARSMQSQRRLEDHYTEPVQLEPQSQYAVSSHQLISDGPC